MKQVRIFSHNALAIRIHNEFFQKVRNQLHGCVVDLGCGTMPYRADLVEAGCRYIGVDWPNSLHGQQPDVVSDLNTQLELPDQIADAVISFSVLEHLCKPEVMLSEACRVLRPGGLLVLQVPFQWWVHEAPHDYYRFTRHGLEFLLNKAGFVGPQIEASGGFWTMLVLKCAYHSVRWIRGPRPFRYAIRWVLMPGWVLGQLMAPLLDRFDPNPLETVGYTVIARKP